MMLYALLTCRIVLNIRAANHRSIHSELHTTFRELPPLAFASQDLPIVNGFLHDNGSSGNVSDEDYQ
jgi:hypothetical protein